MTPSGKAARVVLYVDVRDEEMLRFTTDRRDRTVAGLLAATRRS